MTVFDEGRVHALLLSVKGYIETNDMWQATETMMLLVKGVPSNLWGSCLRELLSVWEIFLLTSEQRTWLHDVFERALIVTLSEALKGIVPSDVLIKLLQLEETSSKVEHRDVRKEFSGLLGQLARMSMGLYSQHNALQEAGYFGRHAERLGASFSIQENVMMAHIWRILGDTKRSYDCIWAAMGGEKGVSRVLVVDTVYTLMLYMLLFSDWRDACFILGRSISDDPVNRLMSKNIAGIYRQSFLSSIDPYSDVLRRFSRHVRENQIPCYGHDHIDEPVSRWFIGENFSVLEDGIGNYSPQNWHRILEDGSRFEVFGFDKRIKTIYLTGKLPIPEQLKDKVIIVNTEELWNKKTPQDQNDILDVFAFPLEKIVGLLQQKKDQIFLTQPLYEERNFTAAQQVEFYKRLLSNYDPARIMIKVHPRDVVDYEKIFSGYCVVKDKFPVEFLKLVGLENQIDKLISVNTSCLYGFYDESKIDLYDKEWRKLISQS